MDLLDTLNINEMRFYKRPMAISADYRPLFKITLICLVLYKCSRAKKATLLKLHLFSWALTKEENRKMLLNVIEKKSVESIHLWSIEPALNRALRFGIAENIFSLDGKYYKLEKNLVFAEIFKRKKKIDFLWQIRIKV